MDRKEFLVSACGVCGIASALVVLNGCKKDTLAPVDFTLDLNDSANAALNTTGGSITKNDVIVVRVSNTTFKAFSRSCTHEGCSVSFASNRFVCPCHNGVFDINGQVISGPPPSPLPQYTVTQSGTVLTVKS